MPDMYPPQPFKRRVQGFARFRVLQKEPDLLFSCSYRAGSLARTFAAGRRKIRMDDDPVTHASISLKKSSTELYVFPLPFLISPWAFFTLLTNSGRIADSGG